jgi:hypothetical protein
MQEGEVFLPDWGNYHGGLNDRFAVLKPRSATTWPSRLSFTLKHCLEASIHAELFVRDLIRAHNLKVRPGYLSLAVNLLVRFLRREVQLCRCYAGLVVLQCPGRQKISP